MLFTATIASDVSYSFTLLLRTVDQAAKILDQKKITLKLLLLITLKYFVDPATKILDK